MNLLNIFSGGGGIMYPILLCLFIMLYIVIERWLVFRKAQGNVGQFMMKVRSTFQKGGADAVLNLSSQEDGSIARIIRRGMVKQDFGIDIVHEAVKGALKEETFNVRKHLFAMAGVAGIAPLLGFLGTVLGLAGVLERPEALGGITSPVDPVRGLRESLLATEFGLVVGILALVFYWYFVARASRFVNELEVAITGFLDLLRQKNALDSPLKVREAESPHHTAKSTSTLVFDDDAYFRKKK